MWQREVITANPAVGQTKNEKVYSRCQKTLHRVRHFGFICAVPQPPNPSSRRRLTVLYSGHVQGVGFRYTTKTVATGFEIAGTVRNLPDGRVELIAEGSHAELDAFRLAILDAGLAGFIRDEQVNWADAKNEFRGFEIAR